MKFQEEKISDGITVVKIIYETEEEKREQEEYAKWYNSVKCNCEKPSNEYYVPDGANKECEKHHWRCGKCHGITQIG